MAWQEFSIQLAQRLQSCSYLTHSVETQTLAQEIETKYAGSAVRTKLLAMDFAADMDADYARLKALVDGLDVAVLVNNVGKSHDIPVPFTQTPEQEMRISSPSIAWAHCGSPKSLLQEWFSANAVLSSPWVLSLVSFQLLFWPLILAAKLSSNNGLQL
jgi:hypothetical protein